MGMSQLVAVKYFWKRLFFIELHFHLSVCDLHDGCSNKSDGSVQTVLEKIALILVKQKRINVL